ncbi:MAG: hypothetical protein KME67_11685 [Candidatus Thiodiazotropha sp. (ex Codakia orbicularis)]|nr:hypothetical protein [Candidatus Thiodiazotropha sp. (ex Codakia orbicularis)]
MAITDYERLLWVLAEEIESSISSCFQKASDEIEWVDSDEEARALMRRLRGIFVASVVGEIEEKIGRSFSSTFQQLPCTPTHKNSEYWFEDMPSTSSPRGRAQVMWAIRIAYTHGNGHINQITDRDVAAYLQPSFAMRHFRGLRVENEIVQVFGDVTYPALKTTLEIYERFGGNGS